MGNQKVCQARAGEQLLGVLDLIQEILITLGVVLARSEYQRPLPRLVREDSKPGGALMKMVTWVKSPPEPSLLLGHSYAARFRMHPVMENGSSSLGDATLVGWVRRHRAADGPHPHLA